jgi:hypothetical protein
MLRRRHSVTRQTVNSGRPSLADGEDPSFSTGSAWLVAA